MNEDTIIAELLAPDEANPWRIVACLLVADGMGGHHGGEVASQLAGETARQIFLTNQAEGLTRSDTTGVGLTERVTESIQYINRVVYKHDAGAHGDTQRKPGTTLTMALVRAQEYCIAHVGDSRAYLIHEERGQVTAEQLTVDDSLVAAAVRDGRLTREQARNSPFRNHLSQAIGINTTVEPQVFIGEWQAGDTLLLCSDGLTEYLSESEIADFVATHESLQAACDGLVTVANHRGGIDNISVVAARVGKPVTTPVGEPSRAESETETDTVDDPTAPLNDIAVSATVVATTKVERATVPMPSLVNTRTEPAQAALTADEAPPARWQTVREATSEHRPKPSHDVASQSARRASKKSSFVGRLMTPAGLATLAGIVIVSTIIGVMAGRHRNASNSATTAIAHTPAATISAPVRAVASPAPTVHATSASATPGTPSVVVAGPTEAPPATENFAPVSIWLDPDRKAIFVACKNAVVSIRSGENKNRVLADPDRPHRALVEFRHWEAAYKQLQKGGRELLCRIRPIRTVTGPEFGGKPYRSQTDTAGHIKMTIPDTDVREDAEYSLEFGKPGAANGQQIATFRVAKAVP